MEAGYHRDPCPGHVRCLGLYRGYVSLPWLVIVSLSN